MSRSVLIDTDPGIDDALALLLALASPELRVEALTTVAGNVSVDVGTANLGRILAVAAPASVPRVARGAAHPLRGPLVTATHVHGDDGLGNLDPARYPARPPEVEMQDAASLILELAARHGPDLVIVALGPLTNLALALARDQATLARAGRIVVMGGAVTVPGNVTAAAEFNIFVDPEAAAAVFAADLPLELVPLDVTRQVLLREGDLAPRLAGRADGRAGFLRDMTAYGFGRWGAMAMHDPLAVGVAIDPTVVGMERWHVDVETEGRHARGLTLADRRERREGGPAAASCRVATTVDAPRFLSFFLERVCRASA
jgi:purine nucleosidase/pyrimidine-specific ribonucleoside hydrolase